MPRRLVNREEQGKLIAQTSGAVTMIEKFVCQLLNESNYRVRSTSDDNTYTVTATKSGGFVHALIMLAMMPSADMYMQSNFVAKSRHFNPLSQVVSRTTIPPVTNKQYIIFLNHDPVIVWDSIF